MICCSKLPLSTKLCNYMQLHATTLVLWIHPSGANSGDCQLRQTSTTKACGIGQWQWPRAAVLSFGLSAYNGASISIVVSWVQFVRLKSATLRMVILFGKPPRLGASIGLTCLHLNMAWIFCQSWCIMLHLCNDMDFCEHVLLNVLYICFLCGVVDVIVYLHIVWNYMHVYACTWCACLYVHLGHTLLTRIP